MKKNLLKKIKNDLIKRDKEEKNIINLNDEFADVNGKVYGIKDSIDESTFKSKSKLIIEKWNRLTFID